MQKKVILITGSARGIGFFTAIQLAEKGHIVYATVHNLKNSSKLLQTSQILPNLKVRPMDITNDEEINTLAEEIIHEEKKIDILINNAAYILFGPIETIKISEAQKQFNVNLFGAIRTVQAFLPVMREKNSGHIIFIGSTSGVHCSAMYGYYSATKFATEAIAYALAINLFPWNIKVSLLEGSATKTDICNRSLKLGTVFQERNNPYQEYISNSLNFLKKIIKNGENPKDIAKFISQIIDDPEPRFRYFPTSRSRKIFEDILKDPEGNKIWKEAEEEYIHFYKKEIVNKNGT